MESTAPRPPCLLHRPLSFQNTVISWTKGWGLAWGDLGSFSCACWAHRLGLDWGGPRIPGPTPQLPSCLLPGPRRSLPPPAAPSFWSGLLSASLSSSLSFSHPSIFSLPLPTSSSLSELCCIWSPHLLSLIFFSVSCVFCLFSFVRVSVSVPHCAYSLSRVRLFSTTWTVARQAPLSMGFSWQEYWSGLPCPPPGDLPNPGSDPRSPTLQADSLPSEAPGKPPSLMMLISVSTKLCLFLFSFLLLSDVMLQTLESILFHAQGAQWIKCPNPTRRVRELSSCERAL